MSQNGDFNNLGNGYITFGLYPQSKKSTNCIVGSRANRRGFYMGGDGELYGKAGDEYYKVEPIKWKILSRNNGELIIVADNILDAHRFDKDDNNYANSEIRKWLNNDFYNSAFNEEQKAQILTTTVDNSLSSTGDNSNKYTCVNTSDKVFLLSYKEVEQYLDSMEDQKRVPTEYALAKGVRLDTDNNNSYSRSEKSCGIWWLRSPFSFIISYLTKTIYYDGCFDCRGVDETDRGVVPALKIKVESKLEEDDKSMDALFASFIEDFLSLSDEDRQKVLDALENGDLKLF